MSAADRRRLMRDLLAPGAATLLPGIANTLAARIVADLGFSAAYVTGAGIANTFLGMPDYGLVTLTEIVDHVMAIRDVYDAPLIVDADTGFGNFLNVMRTVRLLERAGADSIQIEDQVFPKRCGHFDGKEVIATPDMVDKIKAALDARESEDFLIVARTDSLAIHGFEAALERASIYREAGADVTFIEAPLDVDQIAEIPKRLPWPQLLNIVVGGRTPEPTNASVREFGFAGVLYANAALQAAARGMQQALRHLREAGRIGDATEFLINFPERQRLVGKPEFDAIERKFARADTGT